MAQADKRQERQRGPAGPGQGPDPSGRAASEKRLIVCHGREYRRVPSGFPPAAAHWSAQVRVSRP